MSATVFLGIFLVAAVVSWLINLIVDLDTESEPGAGSLLSEPGLTPASLLTQLHQG